MIYRYGVPAVSTLIAFLVTVWLDLSVFPTPLFFAAIVASTWYGGALSGLLATVLATLTLDFYFIPATQPMVKAALNLLQFSFPALLTLWFVKKRREAESSLRASRDKLEVKVQERTSELWLEIAEREKAEATVRQTQAQLAHANRVMTMGELATSIAHEVNQPLASVVTSASACLRWLDAQKLDEARRSASRAMEEGHRASAIIGRIRALTKKVPPQKDWIDTNETINDVMALARSEIQRNGVALETELSEHVPLILADRVQLQQVILNLVMNAIEAMSGLGKGPRELLIRSGTDESKHVAISVQDSGPGIDPENLDHLFEAFYTTKPHGLGMGLAISRSIIEAHGGRLWASANTPRGAVFQFVLPGGSEKLPDGTGQTGIRR